MSKQTNQVSDHKNKQDSKLSTHEREQLRGWVKATPAQRFAWLEEALLLTTKNKKPRAML